MAKVVVMVVTRMLVKCQKSKCSSDGNDSVIVMNGRADDDAAEIRATVVVLL